MRTTGLLALHSFFSCCSCPGGGRHSWTTASANAKVALPAAKPKPKPSPKPSPKASFKASPTRRTQSPVPTERFAYQAQMRTPRQSLQLQEMASTCEDAVRRIDELSAATQHLLRELGISGLGLSPTKMRTNPFQAEAPVEPQAFTPGPQRSQAFPSSPYRHMPSLPTYQPAATRLSQGSTSFSKLSPALKSLEESLALYRPPPLHANRVVLPCGRCIDLQDLWPRFASTMSANIHHRLRIAEDLQSRQLGQKLVSVYSNFDPNAKSLTWSL